MLETETPAVPPVAAGAPAGRPFLSLVIPAFNEERRLGPTLASVFSYFAGRPYTTEVIVVSDGSVDGTSRIAQEAISRLSPTGNVKGSFYEYQPNAGKGRAVRTGVGYTRGRFVGFTDADLSTPVEEVDRALGYLDGAGVVGKPAGAGDGAQQDGAQYRVVIGSRAADGADVARRQPLYRLASARFFNFLRNSIVGIKGLRDTQCGLKVFDGDLARFIFARQRIDGFMFDVETMYIAQRLGVPVLELGVRWADVPESKVRVSSGLRLLPDLTRIRLMHRRLTPASLPATIHVGRA
jgi:dolichyl-phosphate beta-glucosyltransferase